MTKGRIKMKNSISLVFAAPGKDERRKVRLNERISFEYVCGWTTKRQRLVAGEEHFSKTP